MKNDNAKCKIIFIGTSDFGLPAFQALLNDQNFSIVLAITQPDKPVGRKQIITASPIKVAAEKNNITVLQPEHIMDIREKIALLKPDLMIVAAYAQLIPEQILNIPKFGCLNLHASLLPKYRGSSVIQKAILNGDEQTGLSIIKMDKGLDTGPIIAQITEKIKPQDTAESLHDRLAALGADFLADTVKQYLAGQLIPQPQNNQLASFARSLKKSDGLIDWSKPARELERFVRAMWSWPVAWTWWQGKQMKISSVQSEPIEINSYKPGKTFKYNNGLAVQCGKDALIVKTMQLEGKNQMTSEEFLRGHKDFMGSVLG
ncbi:MAG: methionyl-tRNA formyltransferase [Patescibacteria group bacterium]|nr:methionyl-tRNA formyltransferase [Patescibacteria group bacterium]